MTVKRSIAPEVLVELYDRLREAKGVDRGVIYDELGIHPEMGRRYTAHLCCATSPKRNTERLAILRLADDGKHLYQIVRELGLNRGRVWRVLHARETERQARASVGRRAPA